MKDVVLSNKERQVMVYVCNGFTSKEIGIFMDLSPRTVEDYIKNLKSKFNAKNTPHLVFKYIKK